MATQMAALDVFDGFEALRESDPVHASKEFGGWILSRYEHVAPGLRDPRLSLQGGVSAMFAQLPDGLRKEVSELERHVSLWLGALDPANHRRLRSIMVRGFTPDVVERTRALTAETADRLLDAAEKKGSMDAMAEFAHPLPATVIASMLGTPGEDCGRWLQWSRSLTEFVAYGFQQPEVMLQTQRTIVEMTEFLRDAVARYGDEIPDEDPTILAGLLRAHRESKIATLDEILANCVLLLFAGHETTTLLIANTVLALLESSGGGNRDVGAAVQETLRFYSPVQMVRRQAMEDLTVEGTRIRQGEMVWLAIGPANRDPRQFADAGSFRPERKDNRHVAFGAGPHYCLGASLSVMEAEVAVGRLSAKFPGLRLDREKRFEWVANPTARALTALPVVW